MVANSDDGFWESLYNKQARTYVIELSCLLVTACMGNHVSKTSVTRPPVFLNRTRLIVLYCLRLRSIIELLCVNTTIKKTGRLGTRLHIYSYYICLYTDIVNHVMHIII